MLANFLGKTILLFYTCLQTFVFKLYYRTLVLLLGS
jgi:hypothetical protein